MEFGDRDLTSAISLLTRGIEAEDTRPAVAWLGARRGQDGVALEDAFDDLTTAYRVAAGLDPSSHEYRDLALAWAEAAVGALSTRGALDAETGLATRDYLATRLRDIARLGTADTRRLLVVGPGPQRHRMAVMLRAARVAVELEGSFGSAETPVQLPGDRIGTLIADDETLPAGVAGLRRAIVRIDRESTGDGDDRAADVSVHEVPREADEVRAFLERL